MIDKKTIYRFNDNLLFSIEQTFFDNLNTDLRNVNFLCPVHKLRLTNVGLGRRQIDEYGYRLQCPLYKPDSDCQVVQSSSHTLASLEQQALALLDQDIYRNAQLVRLDDYYIPEIKKFDALPNNTNYSIKVDIKIDKDGDTIVILYIGHKGDKEKSQIFIKPEKLQLSSDHKDLDPAKILAKIELTLKNRNITQEYEDSNEQSKT